MYSQRLWHTWFDRDLGIAGRVLYRTADGAISSKLVRIDKPVARIPNLAIHLTTDRAKFEPNLHEHAQALLTLSPGKVSRKPAVGSLFHPVLLDLISEATGLVEVDIVDLELQLIDVQVWLYLKENCLVPIIFFLSSTTITFCLYYMS